MMINQLLPFLILFTAVIIVFAVLKRPMYEAMAVAFVALLAYTGTWSQMTEFMYSACKSSILFTISLFLIFSAILKHTGVIDDCIDIIMAAVGKIPGGAGLVSIVASSFMGAMSGSGPGNIAATGSVTIPLMKKAGYSSEFSAGVAMAGSCLGPVIPPSATILASFACLTALSGYSDMPFSTFWVAMYGVSAVLFVHRIVQMYAMQYAFKERQNCGLAVLKLSEAWKKGWKSFMLVFVILVPFIVDNTCEDIIVRLLGETSAKHFSGSVLIFTPAVATFYSLLISKNKSISIPILAKEVAKDLRQIAPLCIMLFFSYSVSALLDSVEATANLDILVSQNTLDFIPMLIVLIAVATLLGMFMAGTAMIPLLGPIYIATLTSYGVSPVLAAAILPAMFVSLGQMTPPFAVCLYAAMGIANAEFDKMCIHAIIWSAGQILVIFLMLVGIVPVPWI